MNTPILSKPSTDDAKKSAIELMEQLIIKLKDEGIEVKHYWLFQNYVDDPQDEPHNYFAVEWRFIEKGEV